MKSWVLSLSKVFERKWNSKKSYKSREPSIYAEKCDMISTMDFGVNIFSFFMRNNSRLIQRYLSSMQYRSKNLAVFT